MYQLLLVHSAGDRRALAVSKSIEREAARLRIDLEIVANADLAVSAAPDIRLKRVVLYLGGVQTAKELDCNSRVKMALDSGLEVVPVIDGIGPPSEQVSPQLEYNYAVTWTPGSGVPPELLTAVFETLGVVEKERKVFIAYRQTDASPIAIRLHDELVKKRFSVFLDKFQTRSPQNIQEEIDEALEDAAFVLLLYSPDMPSSKWVDWEITRALKSNLSVLVVKWSDVRKEIPKIAHANFPTVPFDSTADVAEDFRIRAPKLKEILDKVELEHLNGLLRRRREAVRTVKEYAGKKDLKVEEFPEWKLRVTDPRGRLETAIVAIAPRLASAQDLYQLDDLRMTSAIGIDFRKVLIQVATELPRHRREFLEWVIDGRSLVLALGVNSLDDVL